MTRVYQQLLRIVSYQLFGGDMPVVDKELLVDILKEAKAQTVYTTVFPFCRDLLRNELPNEFSNYERVFWGNIMTNTNNLIEHDELHQIMTNHEIAYCAIKGLASAYYYPDIALRDMGDVDFIVTKEDFETTKGLIISAGFCVDHGDNMSNSLHIVYKRKPMSIWEQHRRVNGIPEGKIGSKIQYDMDNIIDTAQLITVEGVGCKIPDTYHHGIVMLLHMVSHMTSEGIGLRHLCDWAVFINQISNTEFVELFEEKLKNFGLWKFAQIITLVSEKYLGTAYKECVHDPFIDDEYLLELVIDILTGGNFGKKDMNRSRQIKYISSRDNFIVDNKKILGQLIDNLNKKTYHDFNCIKKHRMFLPIGWVAEGCKYIGMLMTGKRKNTGTVYMLKDATKRKEIYSRMKLFENEQL